ncbi:uncharacterized protein LOC126973056 [Leptidea sinapis]|uniref:uncharacterized protein LOC126973056 n=1 Tax=Leptidea sinapis TaxID=189913 RepID=UPI002135AA10|nr:uncharacterized protein LOC126973056 [Leptidea sinapis]
MKNFSTSFVFVLCLFNAQGLDQKASASFEDQSPEINNFRTHEENYVTIEEGDIESKSVESLQVDGEVEGDEVNSNATAVSAESQQVDGGFDVNASGTSHEVNTDSSANGTAKDKVASAEYKEPDAGGAEEENVNSAAVSNESKAENRVSGDVLVPTVSSEENDGPASPKSEEEKEGEREDNQPEASSKLKAIEKKEMKQIQAEKDAADWSMLLGNPHRSIPSYYTDLGRRFVPHYPYVEIKRPATVEKKKKKPLNIVRDEYELDHLIKTFLDIKTREEQRLTPREASPEFVLEIAKQSALLNAMRDVDPNEFQSNILRSGDYWNDVQVEQIDPRLALRSSNKVKTSMNTLKVVVAPGTQLFSMVSKLMKRSPRLLYVINKSE